MEATAPVEDNLQSSELNDVFISYRRKNVEFAKELVAALKSAGKECWVDWEDIPPGSEGFTDDIKRGLESTDAFLAILSPDYLESTYCVDMELAYAIQLKKKLIPIVIEKFDGQSVPAGVGHINWIYFTPHAGQANTFDESFPKIVQALDQDLDHARTHRRIGLRALEWNQHERANSYLLSGDEILKAEGWISTAAGKNPEPTELHAEYIVESRRVANLRQRQLLMGVSVALLVSMVLLVAAVVLGVEANNQRLRAEDNERRAVRNAAVSHSVALASGARETNTHNQIEAVALALESVTISDPPGLSQRVLAEMVYQPGAKRLLRGHTQYVTSVAYNADGTRAVSGDEAGNMIVWDVATGEIVLRLEAHQDEITGVTYSPDDTLIATSSNDDSVRVWEAETGKIRFVLTGHTDRVLDVAFSPDGLLLASAGRDEVAILWDSTTGEQIAALEGHRDRVHAVAFSPDGKLLATASRDQSIILWDLETRKMLRSLEGHTDAVNTLAFSPDGRQLATGAADNQVIVWDVSFGGINRELSQHTRSIQSVAFSPDGSTLLTGSDDQTVRWWSLDHEDPLHVFTGIEFVRAVAFSPTNQGFISVSRDADLVVWDLVRSNIRYDFADHTAPVYGVAYSPDGQFMASASDDGLVNVYSTADGRLQMTLEGHADYVNAVTFSHDGQSIASADESGVIMLWETSTGKSRVLGQHDVAVHALAFSPEDTQLLSGAGIFTKGEMRLWDVTSGDVLNEFEALNGTVWDVAISPDGAWAASASEDNTVRLWSLKDEGIVHKLSGHNGAVRDVDFSPDGTRLVSASFDRQLLIWDVDAASSAFGTAINRLIGHADAVRAAAFSPDGTQIVSGGDDATLLIWDVMTGEAIRGYSGHRDVIYAVAYGADNHAIASGSLDNHAIVWKVDTLPELVDFAVSNRYVGALSCLTGAQFDLEIECQ